MKRIVMALDLKPDPVLIERYCAYHRNVWPEVVQANRDIGIKSTAIYRLGNRLVNVIEADDCFDPACFVDYASSLRAKEWDNVMRAFQQPAPGAKPGEWWTEMEELYSFR